MNEYENLQYKNALEKLVSRLQRDLKEGVISIELRGMIKESQKLFESKVAGCVLVPSETNIPNQIALVQKDGCLTYFERTLAKSEPLFFNKEDVYERGWKLFIPEP